MRHPPLLFTSVISGGGFERAGQRSALEYTDLPLFNDDVAELRKK
jgi:hypothetical protein